MPQTNVHSDAAVSPTQAEDKARATDICKLFGISFLALYFELVIIRYLATEIRVFAYFKNLPLIASFFGLGLGMAIGPPIRKLNRIFPFVVAILFLCIALAPVLHLTHVPAPTEDYFMFGQDATLITHVLQVIRYAVVMLSITSLVIAFFVVVGCVVGDAFSKLPPLTGYAVNLAGSLTGILAFTALSFLRLPPGVWLLIGLLVALPFMYQRAWMVLSFLTVILVVTATQGGTYWSPYYRIALEPYPYPGQLVHPQVYLLTANHDGHQTIFDHSAEAIAGYPPTEFNRSALPRYDFAYELPIRPSEVLVVGAGTGNDVAAALRHGATHVDAVEIDPVIVDLGKQFHHEQPYQSDRVVIHIDDARAFFHKTNKHYDLIVFGFLDSLTVLSSYSSVRLDNFVYTVDSLVEAKNLLRPGGTLILSFNSQRPFLTERLFATMERAFGTPPAAYQLNAFDIVLLEGAGKDANVSPEFKSLTADLERGVPSAVVATDQWPFLYLTHPTIPKSMLWVLIPFLIGCVFVLHKSIGLQSLADGQGMQFFFLGAGFLLLETKAVMELSLLFGSTWIVNALVITVFVMMALVANFYAMWLPVSRTWAYVLLLAVLAAELIVPYERLNSMPEPAKIFIAGLLIGLPIFFSGLIFSRSFRDVINPGQALGVNLLGAVIGGVLENTVMLVGTHALDILAILLYALAAISLRLAITRFRSGFGNILRI